MSLLFKAVLILAMAVLPAAPLFSAPESKTAASQGEVYGFSEVKLNVTDSKGPKKQKKQRGKAMRKKVEKGQGSAATARGRNAK